MVIATLCSDRCNSVLHRHSKEQLLRFKWDDVHLEMQEHAPVFLSLLHAASHTQCSRPMCTVMLCKLQMPEMSTAHKTLSLILYAAHVHSRLSKIHIHKVN